MNNLPLGNCLLKAIILESEFGTNPTTSYDKVIFVTLDACVVKVHDGVIKCNDQVQLLINSLDEHSTALHDLLASVKKG